MKNQSPMGRTLSAVALTVVAMIVSTTLKAQGPPMARELKLDAVVARQPAIEAGGSLVVPGGIYVRTAFTAMGGLVRRDSGSTAVGRAEIVSRFLLDPFRDSPYGLSIGGGVGITNIAATTQWRPYLALVVDLEVNQSGTLAPAIQLGLGDGARLGVVLRSGVRRWR